MTSILQQDIQYLPGVGPNRRKMLSEELDIHTFGDLLQYYPYKHVDRSRLYSIGELNGDMPFVQVKGHILSFDTYAMGPRKERVVAHFTDGSGKVMDLTWFNGGKYAKQNYAIGKEYIVFGRPNVYNGRINVTHPDIHQRHPPRHRRCRETGTVDNGHAALLQHDGEDEENGAQLPFCRASDESASRRAQGALARDPS